MSNSRPITTVSSSSNFQLIFNNALKAYEKRTKNDLLVHPLAAELQNCNSPRNILDILHQQVQGLDQSQNSDDRWTKWLDPTVNVLYMLSETLGKVSAWYSHRNGDICRSWGLLSQRILGKATKRLLRSLGASKAFSTPVDLHASAVNPGNVRYIIRIMVEVLTILGIATKE
ncbi:hypothetical protein BGY98DRAFT_1102340 [Russula aff. rugulosa BPL654]|nr:hypothetical protein BGY98DRAFT_1102340 [Russula aff. rugulosa BPL654]